jgi:hypothetical protein
VTAELVVPTFTENVKVRQPRGTLESKNERDSPGTRPIPIASIVKCTKVRIPS